MKKFKAWLYRSMYGRYGMDTLGKVMMVTYLVILLVHTVLAFFIDSPFYDLCTLLAAITLVIIIFWRMMSRKVDKRRKENQKFCAFFKLRKNKFRDRKTHVYRECPQCHATLRLPKAKGKHSVVCPRCKTRFQVKG